MAVSKELGEFLRSRRARVRPEDVDLQTYGERRRVAGLRREEVALLARISVPYYVRLEQGRVGNVSDEVLGAVARVLELNETEHAHLRDLARQRRTSPSHHQPPPRTSDAPDHPGTPGTLASPRAPGAAPPAGTPDLLDTPAVDGARGDPTPSGTPGVDGTCGKPDMPGTAARDPRVEVASPQTSSPSSLGATATDTPDPHCRSASEAGVAEAASPEVEPVRSTGAAHDVRPTLRRVLDAFTHTPAFVLGRRTEMLACNRLAALLFWNQPTPPLGELNCARLVFLDEDIRALFRDWEHKARETVAFLRLNAGRHPDDRELAALVGELSMKSGDFRRLWAEYEVKERSIGRNVLDHPLVGELVLDYDSLRPGDDEDQVLITYLAEAGSRTEEALRFLASWHDNLT